MHLVHNDVRDTAELGVALQPPQQDTRGAVQQPGGRRLAAQRGFYKGQQGGGFAAATRDVPTEMFSVTLTLSRRIW